MERVVASRALPMGTVLAGFSLVRPLDAARVPTYAARAKREDGSFELAAIERVPLDDDEHAAQLARAGKRLLSLSHPNVARTKALELTDTELLFVSEFVDGERYDVVTSAATEARRELTLVVQLRVLVDVLSGLSALHLLRDSDGELRLMHGEVCPAYIILGLDGNAKIAHVVRQHGDPSTAASGYAAPEVRLGDAAADHRADVYSCGVLLWEALAGRRLFKETSGILPRQLSDKLEVAPIPPQHPWAAPLAEVAARALAADPQVRFASTAELAAEVRKIAGAKLALKSALASLVKEIAGERITERRRELAGGSLSAPVKKAAARPVAPPMDATGDVPKIRDSILDEEETRQIPSARALDDDDAHGRVTHIPGDEFEEPKKVRLPAGLSHGVRPRVVDLPPSAIVTPSKPDERYGEEQTTRKTTAASLPTRPFAFAPPAAAVRSPVPPPHEPPAARPLPKPLAPPLPATARLATPKPMPSPLPPRIATPAPAPAPQAPPPAQAATADAEDAADDDSPSRQSAARNLIPAGGNGPKTPRRRQVVFRQSSRPPPPPDENPPPPETSARISTPRPVAAADASAPQGLGVATIPRSASSQPTAMVSEPIPTDDFAAPLLPRKNMRSIVIGVVAFAALVLVLAAVRAAMRSPDDVATPGPTSTESATAAQAAPPIPPPEPAPTNRPAANTTAASTAKPTARPGPPSPPTATAATQPPTTTPPPSTAAAAPEPGGSATSPDHDRGGSRPKVTPRPKGTYDPLGI
jgi:eukaryotic-like serine/threonine-protein kinase